MSTYVFVTITCLQMYAINKQMLFLYSITQMENDTMVRHQIIIITFIFLLGIFSSVIKFIFITRFYVSPVRKCAEFPLSYDILTLYASATNSLRYDLFVLNFLLVAKICTKWFISGSEIIRIWKTSSYFLVTHFAKETLQSK